MKIISLIAILLYSLSKKIKRQNARSFVIILGFLFVPGASAFSQCGSGYYNCTVNWDNLDYLTASGAYSGYVTNAMSETQKFAIGINYLTITRQSSVTTGGENTSHTGEASSYGTGADVEFGGTGTITLTFNAEVQNVRFSIYDIDNLQSITITATNAASAAQNITMVASAGASSILTITGSGTASARAVDGGASTSVSNNSNAGAVNVTIPGTVKTVTIATGSVAGLFWLSDISACVFGTFTNNYHSVMRPYTGQPSCILSTCSGKNAVFKINVATGQVDTLFSDPAVSNTTGLNSLAFDPVKNNIYYITEGITTSSANKTLKKYNADTETISTVIPDITALGIPTFEIGLEEAGASFYDGWLFLGIEGFSPDFYTARENIIWRISFDASGNAISACQAAGWPVDDGSSTDLHGWGDFAVIDSMIIDFNSHTPTYAHYNMRTGNMDNSYVVSPEKEPTQIAVLWNNQVYWIDSAIAIYNGNGTLGSKTPITGAGWSGRSLDGASFRLQSDFGDAPASYDPDPLSPALHMKDTALRLGPAFDQEFVKTSSAMADGDGADEDGIAFVNLLDTATFNYSNEISVYNNTGADAVLIGWLDINGNGTFEPSEAVSVTVPHGGPTLKTVTLIWWAVNTPLTIGQTTFLRTRLTSASNGMTVNNPTGYFPNGEVEDYIVYINAVLPINLVSFSANLTENKKVKLDWSTENETNINDYEIQRSSDGIHWQTHAFVNARNQGVLQKYQSWDYSPLPGKSQYRLQIVDKEGISRASYIAHMTINKNEFNMILYPNPADKNVLIKITALEKNEIRIRIFNIHAKEIFSHHVILQAGENNIPVRITHFPAGVYLVCADNLNEKFIQKLIKK